jgi:hypothetical protein
VKEPAKALFDLICSLLDESTGKEGVSRAHSHLVEVAGCDFDADVEKWVSWYMTNVNDSDDREVVETIHSVYKTRKLIERGIG